jgi:hypothetical protein
MRAAATVEEAKSPQPHRSRSPHLTRPATARSAETSPAKRIFKFSQGSITPSAATMMTKSSSTGAKVVSPVALPERKRTSSRTRQRQQSRMAVKMFILKLLAIPVILFVAFFSLNVYLNREYYKSNVLSGLFDLDELFEDVDFVKIDMIDIHSGRSPCFDHDCEEEEHGFSPVFQALVTSCHDLDYTGGEDEREDRPGHIRAASSLVWTHHDQLVVLQDDVNFIGLVDMIEDVDVGHEITRISRNSSIFPNSLRHGSALGGSHSHYEEDAFYYRIGDVWSIAVPRVEGSRQFHKQKNRKFDLEAAVYIQESKLLIAFGSGSAKGRSKLVIWNDREKHQDHFVDHDLLRVVDADSMYKAFREDKRFSGSELNIEGAALYRDRKGRRIVRLFQRGNGADTAVLPAISASCDLVLEELLTYISNPTTAPVPKLRNIKQYDLGKLLGVKLSFTDASHIESDPSKEFLVFLAGAEDSPDSFHDGAVMGSTLGILKCDIPTKQCTGKQVPLTLPDGKLFREKAEGLVLERNDPNKGIIVIDPDDPRIPAKICSVTIRGHTYD